MTRKNISPQKSSATSNELAGSAPVWEGAAYRKQVLKDVGVVVRWAKLRAKLSTGAMERFLREVGVSGPAYSRWDPQGLKGFIAANRWMLRDWQLLVVENLKALRAAP